MKSQLVVTLIVLIAVFFYEVHRESFPYECQASVEYRLTENSKRLGFENGEMSALNAILSDDEISKILSKSRKPVREAPFDVEGLRESINFRPSMKLSDGSRIPGVTILSIKHPEKDYSLALLKTIVKTITNRSAGGFEVEVLQGPSVYCSLVK